MMTPPRPLQPLPANSGARAVIARTGAQRQATPVAPVSGALGAAPASNQQAMLGALGAWRG